MLFWAEVDTGGLAEMSGPRAALSTEANAASIPVLVEASTQPLHLSHSSRASWHAEHSTLYEMTQFTCPIFRFLPRQASRTFVVSRTGVSAARTGVLVLEVAGVALISLDHGIRDGTSARRLAREKKTSSAFFSEPRPSRAGLKALGRMASARLGVRPSRPNNSLNCFLYHFSLSAPRLRPLSPSSLQHQAVFNSDRLLPIKH